MLSRVRNEKMAVVDTKRYCGEICLNEALAAQLAVDFVSLKFSGYSIVVGSRANSLSRSRAARTAETTCTLLICTYVVL